jgi:hypothetical protein
MMGCDATRQALNKEHTQMNVDGVVPFVTHFLWLLSLPLSTPQSAHLARLVQALAIYEGKKTLARILRLFPAPVARSSLADFLTQSPWREDLVMLALRMFFFQHAARWIARLPEKVRQKLPVIVRLDDTTVEKHKDSTHFTGIDFHYDHNKGRHVLGYVFVTMLASIGPLSMPVGFRLYLRSKTLRRLRRVMAERPQAYGLSPDLRFKSKLTLARELLGELEQELKGLGLPVCVMFDSWYASNSLLRFCQNKGWKVICAVKSNRKLQGKQLCQWARTLGKRKYSPVEVETSGGEKKTFWATSHEGRIQGLASHWRVVFSLRNKKEKNPFYLLTNDLTLSLAAVLQLYQGRWGIEVLHWNLKVKLGLGDFRVRSLVGICRWMVVCFVAQSVLQWKAFKSQSDSPCEAISTLRRQHAQMLISAAIRKARRRVRTKTILQKIVPLLA